MNAIKVCLCFVFWEILCGNPVIQCGYYRRLKSQRCMASFMINMHALSLSLSRVFLSLTLPFSTLVPLSLLIGSTILAPHPPTGSASCSSTWRGVAGGRARAQRS